MGATLDPKTDISLKVVRNFGTACFGGQGLLLNRLKGKGWVFLNAAGTVFINNSVLGRSSSLTPTRSLRSRTPANTRFSQPEEWAWSAAAAKASSTAMTGPGLVIVQSMWL